MICHQTASESPYYCTKKPNCTGSALVCATGEVTVGALIRKTTPHNTCALYQISPPVFLHKKTSSVQRSLPIFSKNASDRKCFEFLVLQGGNFVFDLLAPNDNSLAEEFFAQLFDLYYHHHHDYCCHHHMLNVKH